MAIELSELTDLALWRDAEGKWQGVLQDWTGPVPARLAAITSDWRRLALPTSLAK